MSKIKFFSLLNLIITITSNSVSISLNKKIENNFFTIPISIGIPNNIQIFEVQVDTTTSETWVPSINTTYKISPKYDMSLSSTSNTTDKIMEIFFSSAILCHYRDMQLMMLLKLGNIL